MKTEKLHYDLIQECNDKESQLTDWELSFISSVEEVLADCRKLTQPQIDKLYQIHEKVNSE